VQALRVRIPAAFNLANTPPIDLGGISVLLVASDDATLAADALRHIKVKAVLFPQLQTAFRNSRHISSNRCRTTRPFAEPFPTTLGGQQKGCALFFCTF
jgi:hypothetical protein